MGFALSPSINILDFFRKWYHTKEYSSKERLAISETLNPLFSICRHLLTVCCVIFVKQITKKVKIKIDEKIKPILPMRANYPKH